MKTKALLLICLLSVIGLTRISAQNGKDGTGSVVYDWPEPLQMYIPVECDGQLVDVLVSSDYTLPCVDHFKDGQLIWWKENAPNLVLRSIVSKEIFTLTGDRGKYDMKKGVGSVHFNLVGSIGNHYIIHVSFDMNNGSLLEYKANCH